MTFTRRNLLSRGAVLVAAGLTAPSFIARTAMALQAEVPGGQGPLTLNPVRQNKILVAVQLSGGNDGLNTLIPFAQFDTLHFARLLILDDKTLEDTRVYGGGPAPTPVAHASCFGR